MHLETAEAWEPVFIERVSLLNKDQKDASHDLGHFQRVYQTAKQIARGEGVPVDLLILLAAAYLHDIVSLPKDHPDNHMSSRYAAVKAKEILQSLHFPQEKIDSICHAIITHSFSAGIQPETIEAKIIQDADRMEALGALGAMRTFYVSGRLRIEPFDPHDLHAQRRPLNDRLFGLDHFYVKLFKLPALLQTNTGRSLAEKRVAFLKYFVEELVKNVKENSGGALFVVSACYQADRQGLQLFDSSNPLAQNRPLNPTSFVVDQLIQISDQFPAFIRNFLSQLQEEIQPEFIE